MSDMDIIFDNAAIAVKRKIEINPNIYGGAPVIAGTRVPVYAILEMLLEGRSSLNILKNFPQINAEDYYAAIEFAKIIMER